MTTVTSIIIDYRLLINRIILVHLAIHVWRQEVVERIPTQRPTSITYL